MEGLLFLFGLFLALGLFFLTASVLKLPTMGAAKAMLGTVKQERKAAKTLETYFMILAVRLSGFIRRFFRNYPFLCFPTYLSFASNKRFLQRPYIVRFIIFNRLFVPSTKPLL